MIHPHNKINIVIILLLCAALLTGCTAGIAPHGTAVNSSINPEDISAEYDVDSAVRISLGNKISISGSGAELQRSVVTIFREGTYVLEGTLPEGQLVVDAADSSVQIVLNGADITCSYSAPLYIKNAARVVIILADGTQNSLSDMNSRPSDDSIDGAIYTKAPMALCGEGSLTVSGAYKHGISSKEAVTVCGGDMYVSAPKTGLDSRGEVILTSCSLSIDAGTNGIRSGREDSPANISILGGNYAVSSAGDGMQSYGNIDISGGSISVITGGGSAEAPVKYSEFSMNGRGSLSAETDDDTSRKGIKATGDIAISGGSISVDSYDDGFHADGNIAISHGEHTLSSGDDGIHAEGALLISGGSTSIPYCYEGLEGKSVTITDGTVSIHANDDGINTAADEAAKVDLQPAQAPTDSADSQMPDNMTPPNGMDMPEDFTPPDGMEIPEGVEFPAQEGRENKPSAIDDAGESNRERPEKRPAGDNGGRGDKPGGFGGMGGETAQDGVDITISGGIVTVSAEGDCMDSNGSIYITGGTVYVSANRYPVISAAEAGLDCNGSLTVSGGSLIGTGTSASQTNGLENAAIVYYGESTFDESVHLSVSDADGNTMFEFSPAYSFNSVLISSPLLTVGETYTLTIGDFTQQIQLTEQLLTVGESSGGFGGRGGFAPRPNISPPLDPAETAVPSYTPDAASPSA